VRRSGTRGGLHPTIAKLADSLALASLVRDIERLLAALAPHVPAAGAERSFVHGDLREMNVLCTSSGELQVAIDWGDAGWGYPARDFVSVSFETMEAEAAPSHGSLAGRDGAGRHAPDRSLRGKHGRARSGS
jgi:aminoglycoside phosphotransferase (APT) family kinase protein